LHHRRDVTVAPPSCSGRQARRDAAQPVLQRAGFGREALQFVAECLDPRDEVALLGLQLAAVLAVGALEFGQGAIGIRPPLVESAPDGDLFLVRRGARGTKPALRLTDVRQQPVEPGPPSAAPASSPSGLLGVLRGAGAADQGDSGRFDRPGGSGRICSSPAVLNSEGSSSAPLSSTK